MISRRSLLKGSLATLLAGVGLAGYAFGLGYFLAGVSWVYVSLHDFGSMPAPLAALATFLFCAYLAIFFGAAGWMAVRLGGKSPSRRLLFAALAAGVRASDHGGSLGRGRQV